MLVAHIAKLLILPPGGIILALAVVVCYRHALGNGLAFALVALIVLLLWWLSTPAGAYLLTKPLLKYPALDEQAIQQAIKPTDPETLPVQAIVVLGGGRQLAATEFAGRDMPSRATLARLTYAAHLWHKASLPLITAGGKGYSFDPASRQGVSEAQIMEDVLRDYFGVEVSWQEPNSRNTYENAVQTAALLHQHQLNKVFLVTSAVHMQRSVMAFSQQGIKVVPAPTATLRAVNLRHWGNWLPKAGSLASSSRALHEWLGLLWYRINGYS